MTRDPRVDPRPGDVVMVGATLRRVTSLGRYLGGDDGEDPTLVLYKYRSAAGHNRNTQTAIQCWRSVCADAVVVEVAP